MKPDLFETQ